MDAKKDVFALRARRQLMQKQRLDLLRRQATVDGLTAFPTGANSNAPPRSNGAGASAPR